MHVPDPLLSRTLQIGPLAIQISTASPALWEQVGLAYPSFIIPAVAQPDLRLEVAAEAGSQAPRWEELRVSVAQQQMLYTAPGCQGRLDASGSAHLEIFASHPFLETDQFLRISLGFLALMRGGVLLHTAGVVQQGRAYLFFGHSGSGKTTAARLSAPRQVLNDDLVLLLPASGADSAGWLACATPFTNPSQVPPGPGQAPLASIFRLRQDTEVYLEPISQAAALAELLSCLPLLAVLPQELSRGFAILTRLTQQVPCSYLHFRKDDSFWLKIAP